MTEAQWDAKLHIQTCGRDAARADAYRYPYEPTPYSVLERLADSSFLDENNLLIDYGCGKGRVSFFLNYALGLKTVGIEYDEELCRAARENLNRYAGRRDGRIEFVLANAEEYEPKEADCFYFFNPFSVKVLNSVLGRIFESYYARPRKMRLFFYYPDDDYVAYLMSTDELQFLDEINCQDLFRGKNPRERILIFEIEETFMT